MKKTMKKKKKLKTELNQMNDIGNLPQVHPGCQVCCAEQQQKQKLQTQERRKHNVRKTSA